MPELDHLDPRLDRAFEALTSELAHVRGPGASAAVSTARRRRRTRVGAIALAAIVVVGGGLATPRLLSTDGGVASGGDSAPLDAAALQRATEGWVGGWRETMPTDVPQFGAARCLMVERPPEPEGGENSYFVGDGSASAVMSVGRYPDVAAASDAAANALPDPDACGTSTTIDVDGLKVRHDSMPPLEDGPWLTDIFVVQIGTAVAEIHVCTTTGVADSDAARRVAQALVAGVRSGRMQDPAASDPLGTPVT